MNKKDPEYQATVQRKQNMDLWNSLAQSDLKYLKKVSFGQRSFTSMIESAFDVTFVAEWFLFAVQILPNVGCTYQSNMSQTHPNPQFSNASCVFWTSGKRMLCSPRIHLKVSRQRGLPGIQK